MRNRPTFAMSAIVVGTYVCALYGALGTRVSARPLNPNRATARQVMPATQPTNQADPAVAGLADLDLNDR